MTDRLKALADAGVSIWLDDLSRDRLETGNLADLVAGSQVVGVTTNPSIFAAALENGEAIAAALDAIIEMREDEARAESEGEADLGTGGAEAEGDGAEQSESGSGRAGGAEPDDGA